MLQRTHRLFNEKALHKRFVTEGEATGMHAHRPPVKPVSLGLKESIESGLPARTWLETGDPSSRTGMT